MSRGTLVEALARSSAGFMGSDVAERNRRIAERFIEGILDGRLDVVDQLCAPGSSTTRRRRKLATGSTE